MAAMKPRAKSSQYILKEFLTIMEDISERRNKRLGDDTQPIKISWISAHCSIQGNELVDGEAKLAARGKTSVINALPPLLRNSLPRNVSAIKQEFNE